LHLPDKLQNHIPATKETTVFSIPLYFPSLQKWLNIVSGFWLYHVNLRYSSQKIAPLIALN
jgi:hypothetical protein